MAPIGRGRSSGRGASGGRKQGASRKSSGYSGRKPGAATGRKPAGGTTGRKPAAGTTGRKPAATTTGWKPAAESGEARGRKTREPIRGRRAPRPPRPAPQKPPRPQEDREEHRGRDDGWIIEGRQPVREALRAGRPLRRILIADSVGAAGIVGEIIGAAKEAGVRIDKVPRVSLDSRSVTNAHQGVMAEASLVPSRPWQEGLAKARAAGQAPLILALDEIQDPQNLGALLRSAEVLGAHAVIITKRRSAAISPMVIKGAAGATEHLIIDEVANLERTLATCKEEGLWVVALAGEGAVDVDTCDLLAEPVVLVVGSEGKGVSALIARRADAVVRVPMQGQVESLNASAAGAICLWEAAKRRAAR